MPIGCGGAGCCLLVRRAPAPNSSRLEIQKTHCVEKDSCLLLQVLPLVFGNFRPAQKLISKPITPYIVSLEHTLYRASNCSNPRLTQASTTLLQPSLHPTRRNNRAPWRTKEQTFVLHPPQRLNPNMAAPDASYGHNVSTSTPSQTQPPPTRPSTPQPPAAPRTRLDLEQRYAVPLFWVGGPRSPCRAPKPMPR